MLHGWAWESEHRSMTRGAANYVTLGKHQTVVGAVAARTGEGLSRAPDFQRAQGIGNESDCHSRQISRNPDKAG